MKVEFKGRIEGVRKSSFKAKDGTQVDMVYFDLYDVTAKLVPCEMRLNGSGIELAEEMRITCECTKWKKLQWGDGITFVVRNVRELAPVVPITPAPPAAQTPPTPAKARA